MKSFETILKQIFNAGNIAPYFLIKLNLENNSFDKASY